MCCHGNGTLFQKLEENKAFQMKVGTDVDLEV